MTASSGAAETVVNAAAPVMDIAETGGEILGDADGCAMIVAVVAIVTAIVVTIQALWVAPAFIFEAMFEAALAAALARSAKRIDQRGWVGAVWRATLKPFLATLVFAGVVGAVADVMCPGAPRLMDAFRCIARRAEPR